MRYYDSDSFSFHVPLYSNCATKFPPPRIVDAGYALGLVILENKTSSKYVVFLQPGKLYAIFFSMAENRF